jgi:hypothetical protein
MPSRWVHWFSGTDENDRIRVEREKRDAEAWLDMVSSEAFKRHLDWIDREINRPFQIGSQNEMISAAVRSNTFKEIREEIRKATEQAKGLLSAERGTNV